MLPKNVKSISNADEMPRIDANSMMTDLDQFRRALDTLVFKLSQTPTDSSF